MNKIKINEQKYQAIRELTKGQCIGCVAQHNLKLCFKFLNLTKDYCQDHSIIWEVTNEQNSL